MFDSLYNYLNPIIDFDFWTGNFFPQEIFIALLCVVCSCVVAFFPIAFVIKLIRRLGNE